MVGSEQEKSVHPSAILSSLAPEIRIHDRDRYLATLFAPTDCRDELFAIYAFDHEIAKVRRLVREPMAGLIRLQWWREALGKIETGEIPAHPVVEALDHVVNDQGLDVGLLEAAIQARERELEEAPPNDMTEFEQHLVASHGSIVRASVMLLGRDDAKIMATADELGQCLGFLENLRLLLRDGEQRQLWLPSPFLREHGLGAGDQKEGPDLAKIRNLREALAMRARDHLRRARQGGSVISRRELPAFFPGTLAEGRLFDTRRSREDPLAPIRLLWHWLRGRF